MRTVIALTKRNLTAYFRNKIGLVTSLIMPIVMLLMFGFMMKVADTGISSPMNYLISGMVLMIVFQGAISNSNSVMNDMASGFMKEIIVAPVRRTYIALGNILSAAVVASIQGFLVLLLGIAAGFRTTPSAFAFMLLLMLLAGVISAASALLLELIAKNQSTYQMLSMFLMIPLMFLSGAYIPTTILPRVALPFVYINPLTYLTAAFRYISLNMESMSMSELVSQGVAFPVGSFVITPVISWIFVIGIGTVVFLFCVRKFQTVDLSAVKAVHFHR
ncbi:MAG: ABC transporter permease [Eubacterium sp.]